MPTGAPRDYVLSTGDKEIARLALQHRIWRPVVHDSWARAGIGRGSRVLDLGAGPGAATFDLANLVGPLGAVIAVERFHRFVEYLQAEVRSRDLTQVTVIEADLMGDSIAARGLDFAWCRWVASFVSSPATLVERIAGALRVGGRVIFHEYLDYSTWRLVPECVPVTEFVARVMKSWRSVGGEPNVAPALLEPLSDAGFKLIGTRPLLFCAGPSEEFWQWPAAFLRNYLVRLVELAFATQAFADSVAAAFAAAERDPRTLMLTPMVLEIIAEKSSGT
jgi:SAM-dependent methyltransferase